LQQDILFPVNQPAVPKVRKLKSSPSQAIRQQWSRSP